MYGRSDTSGVSPGTGSCVVGVCMVGNHIRGEMGYRGRLSWVVAWCGRYMGLGLGLGRLEVTLYHNDVYDCCISPVGGSVG